MLNHCILGNAVYCVVEIIFNGIIVFICNIFMSFKVFSACFACFIAKKKKKSKTKTRRKKKYWQCKST